VASPHRVLLAGLALSQTVSWGIVYYAFSVLLPSMERDLGASRAAVSGAFSVALLTSALAAPLAGWIIDRHGPRLLMTGGSIAAAVLLVAWSRVGSVYGLYPVWIGLGLVMSAVLYEPAFAVVTKRFGAGRNRALTTLTLVAGLASTIFLPLTTALAAALGWRNALGVLAALLFVVTVPTHAWLLRETPATSLPDPQSPIRVPALRSDPTFRAIGLVFVFVGLATGALAVHAVSCFVAWGMTPAKAAGLAGLMGAMQIPGRLLFAPLSGRMSAWSMTTLVLGVQLAGLAALATPRPWAPAVFVVLFGMGSGLLTLARATLVADSYGTVSYGSIAGAVAGLNTAARAAGPFLAAVVYERSGGYAAVVWLLGGAVAMAALVAASRAQSWAGGPNHVVRA
jgi:predicted MFS family arabinose efflux permease